jgi:hypothetical protein
MIVSMAASSNGGAPNSPTAFRSNIIDTHLQRSRPNLQCGFRQTVMYKGSHRLMEFVDATHRHQVGFAGLLPPTVCRRTCQRQVLALPAYRQCMGTVSHFFALSFEAKLALNLLAKFFELIQ